MAHWRDGSPVDARDPDIDHRASGRVMTPKQYADIEAGNMIAKNLVYPAKADSAGTVLGARVPIILTSRADSVRSRLASCPAAVLYAEARRKGAALPAA